MAEDPPATPAQANEHSPAGSPTEQKAIDRRWRLWAAGIVVLALSLAGLLGLVLIPAGQRDQSHLTMTHAMRRAAGLEAGSPAVAQPLGHSTSLPVSQVSWDPQIMRILAAGNTQRGAQLAVQTCAACHGDDGSGIQEMGAPALNDAIWLYGGEKAAILGQIHNPRHGVMPAFGQRLDDATVKMLTVYVHSLGGGE